MFSFCDHCYKKIKVLHIKITYIFTKKAHKQTEENIHYFLTYNPDINHFIIFFWSLVMGKCIQPEPVSHPKQRAFFFVIRYSSVTLFQWTQSLLKALSLNLGLFLQIVLYLQLKETIIWVNIHILSNFQCFLKVKLLSQNIFRTKTLLLGVLKLLTIFAAL